VVYTGCEKFRTGCQACPLLKLPFQRISRLEFLRKSRFMAGRNVIPLANSRWTAEKIHGAFMFPHAANVPSEQSARLWSSPTEIATTVLPERIPLCTTATGTLLSVMLLFPS